MNTTPTLPTLRFKHLTLAPMSLTAGRKTPIWSVWNHHYGEKLGEIRWHAPWRQYCFVTQEQVYSLGCLKDIAAAIERLWSIAGGVRRYSGGTRPNNP